MTDMIKGLFDGKRWAALWKAVPDYYVPGFIMTLKISAAGLLTALIQGVIFGTFAVSLTIQKLCSYFVHSIFGSFENRKG